MTTAHSIFGKNKTPVPQGLQTNSFPYHVLIGDWNIVGSSLKLWLNRSDVLCRYTPITIPSIEEQKQAKQDGNDVDMEISFSDEIWWEQLDANGTHLEGKGTPRNTQSYIRGRNYIDPTGVNGASYYWRGFKWLKLFTSNWQLIAHSDNFLTTSPEQATEPNEPIWIVTYFTATMFTDAGIDLYVRGKLADEEYEKIVESLRAHQGDTEADKELQKLAAEMFKISVGNA